MLVSLNAADAAMPGTSGSFTSTPSVTSTGDGVAFESQSRAVPVDQNETSDVFFRVMPQVDGEGNETEGATLLVSVSLDGASGNNRSYAPSVSGDGRFVAFESQASNLVEGDGNGMTDVFLRDRTEQTTVRLTTAEGGDANGASSMPAISADGGFAAFCSAASNLTADDDGIANAYLMELATGSLTRVLPAEAGPEDSGCGRVALSADGAFMAFTYGMAAGDGSAMAVFRYDRGAASVARIAGGGSGAGGVGISGDGGVVAFDSLASDLVEGDGNGVSDVFVWEAESAAIERISVGPDGADGIRDSGTAGVSVSGDGRFVVYSSAASNIVAGDANGATDVFRFDREEGTTRVVSVEANGVVADGPSYSPDISDDGGAVAFVSGAGNMAFGDRNRHPDVYMRTGEFPERAGPADLPAETANPNDFVGDPVLFDSGEGDGADVLLLIATGAAALALLLLGAWFLLGRQDRA